MPQSVLHKAFIAKFKELDPYLIAWVADYLLGRSQQVAVDGETSDSSPVLFGVPQGSIHRHYYC